MYTQKFRKQALLYLTPLLFLLFPFFRANFLRPKNRTHFFSKFTIFLEGDIKNINSCKGKKKIHKERSSLSTKHIEV